MNPPDRAALERVRGRVDLHPLVVGDLLEGRQHPKFETFDGCRYLTIRDVDPGGVDPATTDGDLALDAVVSSHESNVATRQNQDMRTALDDPHHGTRPASSKNPPVEASVVVVIASSSRGARAPRR